MGVSMRKMILELELKPPFSVMAEQVLHNVESYTIIEMVRIDFHHGIKVGIMEVQMREGFSIDDLQLPPPARVVSVIQSSGDSHTCVVQVQAPKEMLGLFREFDLDLIWATPMGVSQDTLTMSVVGEDGELRKLMGIIEKIGTVRQVHVQPASFHQEDLLAGLTDRQREVLIAAKRYGYYDYPRRMNAEELSKRVGVSKATLVEHLRKAEGRLVASLLAGY
jgi:predicted DNA binding protein